MSSPSKVSIIGDSSPGPFEGPEKLLELWFAPSEQDVIDSEMEIKGNRGNDNPKWVGLRQVERKVWEQMLDEVCCKVLSVIEGEQVDAYLLSESSMFVWPHKLILKTCGTTTLLLGLPTLLRIASELCGFQGVWRCFYSRKTFMFPDQQRGPHKDWAQETQFLDKLFENSSAYTVGRMNGDHWLLYLTPPQEDVLQPNALASSSRLKPSSPRLPLASLSDALSSALPDLGPARAPLPSPAPSRMSNFSFGATAKKSNPDQTLEILMSRLSPKACQSFYHPSSSTTTNFTSPLFASDPSDADAHKLGTELSDRLGLTDLLPQATIDSFLFSPCGFSSNAVQGDRYATIHVTPEPDYSYASFECNFDFQERTNSAKKGSNSSVIPGGPNSVQQLVEKVLKIFEPAKLSITLFVSMEEEEDDEDAAYGNTVSTKGKRHEGMKELLNPDLLEKYSRVDRILYEFEGYSLVYAVFELR